jgi:hypothetical protein
MEDVSRSRRAVLVELSALCALAVFWGLVASVAGGACVLLLS